MKKFTVTLLTAIIFTIASMLGCFNVAAEQQEMTMSISMEEYKELVDVPEILSDHIIEADNKTYSFYSQLDNNNKAAYDAMEAAWLQPNTSPISFSLSDKITYDTETKNFSDWTDDQKSEFWQMVFSAFQTGEVVFEYDYPEIFWYDKNLMQVSIGSSTSYNFRKGVYTMTVSKVQLTPTVKEVFGDEATALEAQNFLAEKIADFNVEGDDYYTKLKYMHDYISKNVVYKLDAPYNDTAYGLFAEPYNIICEGYSEAMALLCRKEGIPCIEVIGNVKMEQNMAHMWNYVMMEDGNWYAVDVTWDDLDDEDNPVKYQYFLKGSESFLKNHIPDDEYITPGFVYPQLSADDYVYGDEPIVTTVVTTSVEALTSESTVTEITKTTSVSETATTVTTSITTTTVTVPEENPVKGDFNENGIVDLGDVVALQKKLVKIDEIKITDYEYELNDDGKINVWDLVILKKYFIE